MTYTIVSTLIALLFIFIGVLIKKNPDTLGSLYKRRARYRDSILPEIAQKVGNALIVTAAVIILGCALSIYFQIEQGEIWFILLPILLTSIVLPFISYSVRKKHHSRSCSLRNVVIFSIFGIIVFVLTFIISRPPSIEVQKEEIEIIGFNYQDHISYGIIENINIIEALPEISGQINGLSIGGLKSGDFQLKNEKQATIYLQSSSSPFINIQTKGDKEYFINGRNYKHTVSLYNDIESKVQDLKVIQEDI